MYHFKRISAICLIAVDCLLTFIRFVMVATIKKGSYLTTTCKTAQANITVMCSEKRFTNEMLDCRRSPVLRESKFRPVNPSLVYFLHALFIHKTWTCFYIVDFHLFVLNLLKDFIYQYFLTLAFAALLSVNYNHANYKC